ncbi:winged helix DNA-binding domain-containing protein [Solicola sp. PLA-1-18]|uniref:winged helix DNA-binding domain-containing protein n=1 Tax=Solicola sp. PLA-1-18 TaxID=3380532 RepID=UPI003B804934
MTAPRIGTDERRARIGRRHALAPSTRVDRPVETARAVVALHGTDPASTFLSACARMVEPDLAAVDRALHDPVPADDALLRVLAMRRTVFAVPADLVDDAHAGASDVVAREQRRLLLKMLVESGVTDDPEPWLRGAEDAAIAAIGDAEVTSADLVAADERLATYVLVGAGRADATQVRVASRVLTMLSAEGRVMRARPRGGWTSTQFRWALPRLDAGPERTADEGAAELARRWLHVFGPATLDDLQWWGGWTKTRTRAALAAVEAVDVDLDGAPGLALPGDLDPVEPVEPWVALLPALDPTTMGWKRREHYLGDHGPRLFDTTGNAGPTIWADGRIVGGWAHRDDGEVATMLLEDVGSETSAAVDAEAARLQALLGDVRLKARARRWTPLEKELRA